MPNISEEEFEKLEYQQASEDWRHRDSLTWQLPAVLVAVAAIVVGGVSNLDPAWARPVVLGLAAYLSGVLCYALFQNLSLQAKSREIIVNLHCTKRLYFSPLGSRLLLVLSIAVSIFLIVLTALALCD